MTGYINITGVKMLSAQFISPILSQGGGTIVAVVVHEITLLCITVITRCMALCLL